MWSHSSIAEGNRGSIVALEGLLREVLSNIHPSLEDHVKRLNIITRFRSIVQGVEHLKGASVTPFGSFLSDLYTRWGDLDISIELPADSQGPSTLGKNKKKKILSDVRQALLRGGAARYVQFIPNARVPLLIFEDPYYQISCDISINNGLGILKSKFLYWISQIDTRFRELVFLIKYWAKAQNINDPKLGTLNSFSLSLLIIFHLQRQSPPILPPFKDIYNGDIARDLAGGRNTHARIEEQCKLNVEKFKRQGLGRDNKSTISELFVSFFAQYTKVETLWSQGWTVCTFTGEWGSAFSNDCRIKKNYPMTIKDPFIHVENCARSVTETTLKRICDAFQKTEQSLQRLPRPYDMHSLRQSLFGSSQARPRPIVIPTRINSVNTSAKLDTDNPNKGRSIQVRETLYDNRSVVPKPSVVSSRVISANVPSRVISANTSGKPGQSNKNKGIVLQQRGNTPSNIPTKIESPNSLAADFSRSVSLSGSMPFQPGVASTSHTVSMGQSHTPQLQNTHDNQHYRQQQHTSEWRQPISAAVDSRHYRPQRTSWKPKNG